MQHWQAPLRACVGQVTGPFTGHSWSQVRGISGHQAKRSKKQFQNTFKYFEKMPKGWIIFLGCLLPLPLPFLSARSLRKLFLKLEVSSSLFPPSIFFHLHPLESSPSVGTAILSPGPPAPCVLLMSLLSPTFAVKSIMDKGEERDRPYQLGTRHCERAGFQPYQDS